MIFRNLQKLYPMHCSFVCGKKRDNPCLITRRSGSKSIIYISVSKKCEIILKSLVILIHGKHLAHQLHKKMKEDLGQILSGHIYLLQPYMYFIYTNFSFLIHQYPLVFPPTFLSSFFFLKHSSSSCWFFQS